jgi:hypothetical protein
VLFLGRALPDAPIITLEPADNASTPAYVRLRVINPSKRAMFIDGCSQIPFSSARNRFSIIVDQPLNQRREEIAHAFEIKSRGKNKRHLKLYVAADSTGLLRVGGICDGSAWLLIIWWHRNWALLPFVRVPAFVRVTSKLAAQINPK